jgi:hypothetical protein
VYTSQEMSSSMKTCCHLLASILTSLLGLDMKSYSSPLLVFLIVLTRGGGGMLDTNATNISVNPAPNTTDDADVSLQEIEQ